MNSSRIYLRNIGVQEEELFLECLEQILYPNSHIPLIASIPLEFSKNKSRAEVFFKNFKDMKLPSIGSDHFPLLFEIEL